MRRVAVPERVEFRVDVHRLHRTNRALRRREVLRQKSAVPAAHGAVGPRVEPASVGDGDELESPVGEEWAADPALAGIDTDA
jgi:hypothetical protein